jgi:hypothetical protein
MTSWRESPAVICLVSGLASLSAWESRIARLAGISLDFIGRFESLDQDFSTLMGKLGLGAIELPRKNASRHAHWMEYYVQDPRVKSVVDGLYEEDFETLGYPQSVQDVA